MNVPSYNIHLSIVHNKNPGTVTNEIVNNDGTIGVEHQEQVDRHDGYGIYAGSTQPIQLGLTRPNVTTDREAVGSLSWEVISGITVTSLTGRLAILR